MSLALWFHELPDVGFVDGVAAGVLAVADGAENLVPDGVVVDGDGEPEENLAPDDGNVEVGLELGVLAVADGLLDEPDEKLGLALGAADGFELGVELGET